MPPRSRFKASGTNDAWFALFFIGVLLVAALVPYDRVADISDRPAPVPAAAFKD